MYALARVITHISLCTMLTMSLQRLNHQHNCYYCVFLSISLILLRVRKKAAYLEKTMWSTHKVMPAAKTESLVNALDSIPRSEEKSEGHSQTLGYEKKLDHFFGGGRELFFIEAGARDGLLHSNTFWLEKNRGWTGLLVEGNPNMIRKVRRSGRFNSKLLAGCLSLTTNVSTVDYILAGGLSGVVSEMDSAHHNRIQSDITQTKPWMDEERVGETVKVSCYPLGDVLHQINQTIIDFWSLDTEGSEIPILKTINFDEFMFGLIFVESNSPKHLALLTDFMLSKGFVEDKSMRGNQDSAWVNLQYCEKYTCNTTAT